MGFNKDQSEFIVLKNIENKILSMCKDEFAGKYS